MKRKIYLKIFLAILLFLSIILIKTQVYANYNTIIVNNSEELLVAIGRVYNEANENNIYEIKLYDGIYNIENDISIPNNVRINLNGNTINYTDKLAKKYALYIKTENVEITNGTILGGGIYCNNAKNVKLSFLNISNVPEDGIYSKSSDMGDIKNCIISNFTRTGILLNSSKSGDIINNTIQNGKGTGILLTGPTSEINGSISKNIEKNNVFRCTGDGIGIYHGSHCKEIINNNLDTIGGNHNGNDGDYGIIIDSNMKADTYCTRIANNSIKNITYAGIAVYSGPSASLDNKYQDTGYVENNIENNYLYNCGTYQHSKDWKTEKKKGCLSGIYVDTHARVKGNIYNNKLEKMGEHGIYIHLCSYVNNINYNIVKDCVEAGIQIYHSTVLGNIDNNKIYNSGTHGIAIADSSEIKGIIQINEIRTAGTNGIYMINSSLKNIVSNTIDNVKGVGIYLNEKTKMNDIISNTINMNGQANGFGIKVVNSSSVGSIKNNTIKGKMVYGIRIMGLTNNVNINSNSIYTTNSSKKAFTGIYVIGNDSKKYIIKKNNITGNKTNYGIRVVKGKTDILDNKVKKASYPIYIEKNKYAVKVKGNSLSDNSNNLVKTPNYKFNTNNIKISKLSAKKGFKIKLEYKSSNKIKKYEIYQSTSKDGVYKKIKTTNKNSYTTSKLKKNKKYYYKVCGYAKDSKITIYTKLCKIKNIKTKK